MEWQLRRLPVALRIAVACFVVILGGGYAASLAYLEHHYAPRDDRAGLGLDDFVGSYHGVQQDAPLRRVLQGEHGHQYLPAEADRQALIDWLDGDRERISQDYDSLDLGARAPAEILDRSCVRCHTPGSGDPDAEGIGERVSLAYFDDVARVAFSRELHAVPTEILLVSTHTHALTLATLTLLVSVLFLATSWPRGLRDSLILVGWVTLLMDLASWWLARWHPGFVTLILAGGLIYGLVLSLQLVLIFIELFKPAPRER